MSVIETRPTVATFGGHLRYWRTRRNFTQLKLAHRAATTPRHISFMETGRSRPGEPMVRRLAEALAIPDRDCDDFLIAAGYQGVFAPDNLDSKTMEPFKRAVQYTIDAHQPFPSFAINRWYDILEKNQAAEAMFGGNDPDKKLNIIHSIFEDPDMKDRMVNWDEVAPAMACRLRREAALVPADARLQSLVQMAHETIDGLAPKQQSPNDDLIICPTFLINGQTIRTISMVARFGASRDVFLNEMRIETIFPRDAEAERFFKRLEKGDIPAAPCWQTQQEA